MPTTPLPSAPPTRSGRMPELIPWWAGPALAVLAVIGEFLISGAYGGMVMEQALVTMIVALALATGIRLPSVGLLLLALAGVASLVLGSGPSLVTVIASCTLLFVGAAFGRRPTVALALALIMLLPLAIAGYLAVRVLGAEPVRDLVSTRQWGRLADETWGGLGSAGPIVSVLTMFLVVAWVAGLATRAVLRSRRRQAWAELERDRAETQRQLAQELAGLRGAQAQLARDVHDVVGHSLAVILAQAQAAQYVPDEEVGTMRETLANVAEAARRSLGDVRSLLAGTQEASGSLADLGVLYGGLRAAGNQVIEHIEGTPRPLPPELDAVAHRVLQEMLTNALKHGLPGGAVWVRMTWPTDADTPLLFSVHNLVADPGAGTGGGMGLNSMRHRLDSVGGRLDLSLEPHGEELIYGVSARLPLRDAESSAGTLGSAATAPAASAWAPTPEPLTERPA